MELTIYQVDAFTKRLFAGNPAAVIPLEAWLDDALLQNIAQENNLSETVYFVQSGERFHIRWFTPEVEVDLCGHATLASAWVLFNRLGYTGDEVIFDSASGELRVSRAGDTLIMDFPQNPPSPCVINDALCQALGASPESALVAGFNLFVYGCEAEVAALAPDFSALAQADSKPCICTAPGEEVDFVSRFFAPTKGINEDPVTGSAHTVLAPYWGQRLNKNNLCARQISARGGEIGCELIEGRVKLAGEACLFMEGTIRISV